jgi:hypothetical protein
MIMGAAIDTREYPMVQDHCQRRDLGPSHSPVVAIYKDMENWPED